MPRDADEQVECVVLGATGLVGRHLGRVLGGRGIRWRGTYHARPEAGLHRCAITSPADVREVLLGARPRVVFHCANLAGGVDFCESHPARAREFHVTATQTIGACCQELGAVLVFLSSDYLFDGRQPPYKEADAPHPVNVYGRLKWEAEQWIQAHVASSVMLRTTNVYGWDPASATPNYLMSLARATQTGGHFQAPSYLWATPTYAGDLAEAMVELYFKGGRGTFHVVGSELTNRFAWAVAACQEFGWDASLVNEVAVPPATAVPRPLKSWLATEKFTGRYATELHGVQDGLRLMHQDALGASTPRCSSISVPSSP